MWLWIVVAVAAVMHSLKCCLVCLTKCVRLASKVFQPGIKLLLQIFFCKFFCHFAHNISSFLVGKILLSDIKC